MKYYKVLPQYDNAVVSLNYDFLVGRELYTPREYHELLNKYCKMENRLHPARDAESVFSTMFAPVEISKRRVYWCFGARFEMKGEQK